MAKSIAVLGILVMDVSGISPRLPKEGETILGRGFGMSPGGKGSNQAVAAKRLGADVKLITKYGRDEMGKLLCDFLSAEGLLSDSIIEDESLPSGAALIMVSEKGTNQILVCPGACTAITKDDMESVRPIIEGSDILLCQLECNLDATVTAMQWAKENGKYVILNTAPYQPLSDDILALCDMITPNEVEAAQLVGFDAVTPENAEAACDALRARGVNTVIITLGEHGAFVKNDELCMLVPPFLVKAVDSTGAGDCFNGALAAALAEDMDLLSAIRYANAAAAISVTSRGSAASMPTRAQVEEFLT